MKIKPMEIYNEFVTGNSFKSSLGSKGISEQGKINERFFIGDQWYGAKCGNDRPLVRHNVVKRIGDYKMSQILNTPINLHFSAEGIPTVGYNADELDFNKEINASEVNFICDTFKDYYNTTAERVKLEELNEKVLRAAYIWGSAILYTYWEPNVATGLFADGEGKEKISGDICCEVLHINDIVFADPYTDNLQAQQYIIIASSKDTESVLREARLYGADIKVLSEIEEESRDGKITVYTKLYKEYKRDGSFRVKCIKTTEKSIVRKSFDTELYLYPLAIFSWDKRNNLIYGESEITYLIPNQIAINRMITANVWSKMTMGMPIMLVNGDTVTENITNDPGQIIKIYGSNEDVSGAVKYITPPSVSQEFDESINALIENTLAQNGASHIALGDTYTNNATALITMRDAALMPLKIVKNRFYNYIEDIARIWVAFWISYYGKRALKIFDGKGVKYVTFNAQRYKSLAINVAVEVSNANLYSEKEQTDLLITLFEKGVIDRRQLIERLPTGAVPDKNGLLNQEITEEKE